MWRKSFILPDMLSLSFIDQIARAYQREVDVQVDFLLLLILTDYTQVNKCSLWLSGIQVYRILLVKYLSLFIVFVCCEVDKVENIDECLYGNEELAILEFDNLRKRLYLNLRASVPLSAYIASYLQENITILLIVARNSIWWTVRN